jgi:hypothetical protein
MPTAGPSLVPVSRRSLESVIVSEPPPLPLWPAELEEWCTLLMTRVRPARRVRKSPRPIMATTDSLPVSDSTESRTVPFCGSLPPCPAEDDLGAAMGFPRTPRRLMLKVWESRYQCMSALSLS